MNVVSKFKKAIALVAVTTMAVCTFSISAFAVQDGGTFSNIDSGNAGEYGATRIIPGGDTSSFDYTITGGDGYTYGMNSADYRNLTRGTSGGSTGGTGGTGGGTDAGDLGDRGDQYVADMQEATGDFNLRADTAKASQALDGFRPILSTMLGIIVILVTMGMTIFSAFDIAYIAFPIFRNKCEEAKQTGQGMMASKKTDKNGDTKLRFVTDEAQYAVQAADTIESGKNPFAIYFGKRVVSYVLLAIILFILITGKINVITNIALRVVSGIIDLIDGI